MAFYFRLLFIAVVLLATSCSKKTANSVSKPDSKTGTDASAAPAVKPTEMEQSVLYYTNEFRKKNGLAPLQLNLAASNLAFEHSNNMSLKKTPFGHNGFNERYAALEKKTGKISGIAENVAFGQPDAKRTVESWIKSAPHRKNLLGNFNFMGLGFAVDDAGTIYYTQILFRK